MAASGRVPSAYAVALLLLWIARPALLQTMERAAHDELLPLLGFFLALGGAELFELAKLKGELGALLMGVLLARSAKGDELYRTLMSFKDLFLIGFFVLIGFTALPTWEMLWIALGLATLLIGKFLLFFTLFMAFAGEPGS